MKYKVLREFVNKKGSLYKPGDTADWGSLGEFGKALLRNGFVEPIKEPKVGLSGQYVVGEHMGYYVPKPQWRGEVSVSHEYQDDLKFTNAFASLGMSFETQEECQEWIDKMKAYQILRQDAKGFEPDWRNRAQVKWSGYYDYDEDMLDTSKDYGFQEAGNIFFASAEDLEASFKKHRKEWLTVLGVEE